MSKAKPWADDEPDAIPDRVLAELEAAAVEPGRPLIAVDADEVLVHFADHFAEHCRSAGFIFDLSEYRLDTAIRHPGGAPLTRDEINPLIWGFIENETRNQRPIDGAAAALEALADVAQIVVLTNAPAKVRDDRIANLAELGMPYPVVMNEGGKGRALSWLSAAVAAPVAFVDDSVAQHGSAAKHAPQVMRFHMVVPDILKPIIGVAEGATARTESWERATPLIRRALINGV